MTTISNLFEREPAQWGLRGDPFLWEEMNAKLDGVAVPRTPAELEQILRTTFFELTGHAWDEDDAFPIDRYDRRGMSGGMVCPEFWREVAIPLVMSRHHEAKEDGA